MSSVDLAAQGVSLVAVPPDEVGLSLRVLATFNSIVSHRPIPAVLPLQVHAVACRNKGMRVGGVQKVKLWACFTWVHQDFVVPVGKLLVSIGHVAASMRPVHLAHAESAVMHSPS